MRNALTVDVEDHFHVAAFSQQIDPANWDQFPLRVERNTHRLLDLFAESDVRATFEERLRERRAAPVRLRYDAARARGRIEIGFGSLEECDGILERLGLRGNGG